jgi:hypothetical protein
LFGRRGTRMPSEPALGHPSWCVRYFCTANGSQSGAHRSRPVIANERPLLLTACLYADAASPGGVCIEVRRNEALLALLPAGSARNLGRVLASLGAAADRAADVPGDGSSVTP